MTDYSQLKVPDLDKMLEARGLPVEGHKAEKVAVLEADDASQPPESDVTPPAPESGREVRHATYVLIDGRRTFFDAGEVMPADIINACHVGDHIFEENS